MTDYFYERERWEEKHNHIGQSYKVYKCHGELPDRPFHNFKASWSGDGRILCSSETSYDGYSVVKVRSGEHFPTEPFTILEPQETSIDKFYDVWKRRAGTGFGAPKLWKSQSGYALTFETRDFTRRPGTMLKNLNSPSAYLASSNNSSRFLVQLEKRKNSLLLTWSWKRTIF